MESCWLIEFLDGAKMILSEKMYEFEQKRNFANRKILYESHWFDLQKCRERNRGVLSIR